MFRMDDTLLKRLAENFRKYGSGKIAMRKKYLGIWKCYTWKDYYDHVKYFSLGMLKLGVKGGEKVCILGDNDPEWCWASLSTQAIGAISLGIFPDSSPSEIEYILKHSDTTVVVAKDQEEVDKLLMVKDGLSGLRKIIYWDAVGLEFYKDPLLVSFTEILESGKRHEATAPGLFEEKVRAGKGEDQALLAYTSGTTGSPKGVMISHANLIGSIEIWLRDDPLYDKDEYVSYLCPALVTEYILGIGAGLVAGSTVNFPEAPETVQEDLREIGPHYTLHHPRVWEELARTVQIRISGSTFFKKLSYRIAVRISRRVNELRDRKKKLNVLWKGLYQLAHRTVFGPIKRHLGLSRTRICYTGGASLAPETLRFFSNVGINLKQVYNLTEAICVAMHRSGEVNPETVGHVVSTGVKVRISEEGELLVKGGTVCQGYYKDAEQTRKAFSDGWLCTGDAAHFDRDGQLVYLGRVSEVLSTSKGEKLFPQFVESSLRFSPYIKDAMVSRGEGGDHLVAIIIIDSGNVGMWADNRKIAYTTYSDISQKPEVYDLVRGEVLRVNKLLPDTLQIRKFTNLFREFDVDESELTRTRKLKRGFLESRYSQLIDAMHKEAPEFVVETRIKYRDGKEGTIRTPLKMASVQGGTGE